MKGIKISTTIVDRMEKVVEEKSLHKQHKDTFL